MTDEMLKKFPEDDIPTNTNLDVGIHVVGGHKYWKVEINPYESIKDMVIHSEDGRLFSLIPINDN